MATTPRARVLARIRLAATWSIFVTWTASAIGLGLLFGWALFAEPHKLGEADFSTIVELMGAIAAWVIGVAAWKYQRAAFHSNEQKERRLAVAALNAVITKAQRASKLRDPFRDLDQMFGDGLNYEKLQYGLSMIIKIASEPKWPDSERGYLNFATLRKLIALEQQLIIVVEVFNLTTRKIDGLPPVVRGMPLSGRWKQECVDIAKSANLAADKAEELIKAVEEIRASWVRRNGL